MKSIRCSALPMFMKCSHSQDESDLLIESHNVAADLGTAAHDALKTIVEGGNPDLHVVALRHGVDEKELRILVAFGRKAWEELRGAFPLPECEVEVSTAASQFDVPTDITGHIDVLSLVSGAFANEARFLDWKSGRNEESDYYAQLLGYAACLILGHGAERAVGTVVWLRSQTIETFTFTRADALEFVERLKAQRDNPRYSTGGHCAHCPRSHSCEALLAIGRRDAVIFGNKDLSHTIASGVAKATPAELVSYLRRFKVLKKFGEALEEGIRRRIAEEGPLDSGDGYDLSLVEEPGGRDIDTLKAWPVLQERMTDEEIAGCVTVSASKAEDIVAKKTERGYGAEARRKLAEALEEAGAVTHKTRTILREVRRPRVLKERSK